MNGKPLDCLGTTGEVGKHDFQPGGHFIHGSPAIKLERRTPESQARYYSEKITELVLTQSELRRVVAERDALACALETIEIGYLPDASHASPNAQQFAAETLGKLEKGELRKGL